MEKRKVALVTAAAGAGIGASIARQLVDDGLDVVISDVHERRCSCLLYTSPSPRDGLLSRMPSSA